MPNENTHESKDLPISSGLLYGQPKVMLNYLSTKERIENRKTTTCKKKHLAALRTRNAVEKDCFRPLPDALSALGSKEHVCQKHVACLEEAYSNSTHRWQTDS